MAQNKNKKWSPEEDARLRTLLEGGTSVTLVAAQLKRTVTATKGRAHLLGVSLKWIKLVLKAKRK
jgi:hypothetical protein